MMQDQDPYLNGTWVPCPDCEDWYCRKHEEHVADCDCPGLHGED